MARRSVPKPTEAELAILRILWDRGPSTVRDVHRALSESRDIAYTTVLTFLLIMVEKRLARRDDSARSHVYEAAARKGDVERRIVDDVLEKVFGGSARRLLVRALESRKANRDELREIRRIIDKLEEEAP